MKLKNDVYHICRRIDWVAKQKYMM